MLKETVYDSIDQLWDY